MGEGEEAVKEDERVKELEEELDRMRKEILYYAAEVENVRKAMEKEVRMAEQRGVERVIVKLISIYEQLENAFNMIMKGASSTDQVIEGIKLIMREVKKSLEEEGVEFVAGIGSKFDPYLHEAVGFVETEEVDEGTVVTEVSKGYKVGGKVIRPAKVIVAKKPSKGS